MSKKIILSGLILSLFVLHTGQAQAAPQARTKTRAGIPPYDVVGQIARGNQQWVESRTPQPAQSPLTTPRLVWLADSDARVQPALFMDDAHRTIYTVRNFGGQLAPAVSAVDYGVRHLYSPVLLITGNSDNQAIRLFMKGYNDLEPSLRSELEPLGQALAKDNTEAGFDDRLLANVERHVDYQVGQALKRYNDRVKKGRLVIVGGVIDLTNAYGRGVDRLIIINVNGMTDDAGLRRHQVMTKVGRQLLHVFAGRKQPVPVPAPPVPDKGGTRQ